MSTAYTSHVCKTPSGQTKCTAGVDCTRNTGLCDGKPLALMTFSDIIAYSIVQVMDVITTPIEWATRPSTVLA